MKRKFTLMALMLLAVITASAMPARPNQWRTLTLTDGTQVRATLVGDEHSHWYRGADGNTYVSAANGTYKKSDITAIATRGAQRRAQAARHFANRRKVDISGNRGSYEGTKKGLIILVNFKDQKFNASHTLDLYKQIANTENYTTGDYHGSIKDYFSAQSDGKFTIDFDIVGPVTVSQDYAYYGGNDYYENDQAPEEMIVEACKLVDDQVDFTTYDWGSTGEVDQVYVIYAGKGEADGGDDDTIWPHAWDLTSAGQSLTLDGVKINSYACSAELSSTGIDGIGTICHEFSHCLGYPDLYDTDYTGNFGMSSFDLMDYGGYNGDGFCPAGYTAYEKWIAGWLDYEVLDEDNVTVSNLKPTNLGGKAYVMYNKGNKNEYFILENRQLNKWDEYLPATGLQVIHIDYDATCWLNNVVNTTGTFYKSSGYTTTFTNSHQRHTLVHADNDDDSKYWNSTKGYYSKTTEEGDLYPYKGNNKLSDSSTPSFGLYNNNADGTRNMGCAITDITANTDGTISFNYTAKVETEPTPEGQIFYESFDQCEGTGGNDGQWSGDIAKKTLQTDNAGWSSASANGGDRCAKFGSTKKVGTVTSPTITLTGTAKVTFKAAPFGSDGTSLKVAYGGTTVGTFTMKSEEWTEFSVDITGNGSSQLTFTPTKRFFLDEVRVVANGSSTGINTIKPNAASTDGRIYNLQGQYVGNSTDTLPRGIYIINGKKVIK